MMVSGIRSMESNHHPITLLRCKLLVLGLNSPIIWYILHCKLIVIVIKAMLALVKAH